MSTTSKGTRLHLLSDIEKLGDRLIRFGQALQNPETTVDQLTRLANACGISFKLRVVADSEECSDE
ncbi:MAG: hypothetical protein ACTIOG_07360 [Pseudomonas helleri]|uniref:hypothetical protein n=1 Tax=Pseudomonas helleri TaxID=1608996 RepID=UPI003FCF75A3